MNFEIKTIPANGCNGLFADDILIGLYSHFLDKFEIKMFAKFKEDKPHELDDETNNFCIEAVETYLNQQVGIANIQRVHGQCTKDQWWRNWSFINILK